MDFKSRNPHIDYWRDSMLETMHSPFPFDAPMQVPLFQIDAPDQSTQFLGLPFDMCENEELMVTYLVEAPSDCPMRQEFECGELTWQEFWQHRGWLIEYKYEFHIDGGAFVRYVHPSHMIEREKHYMIECNNISPMELKLEALESFALCKWPDPMKSERFARMAAEFRDKYPQIAKKLSKKPKAA